MTGISLVGTKRATKAVTIQSDTVTIKVVPGQLKYATTAIEAKAGTEFTIHFVNNGVLPHNVVLVKSREDIYPVGIAAMQAQAMGYIPASEKDRIIGHTSLVGPGGGYHVHVHGATAR